jgi:hypothetical protein
MRGTRVLPIVLEPPAYSRLEQLAAAEDRDALGQARWILRQALQGAPDQRAEVTEPDRPHDAA